MRHALVAVFVLVSSCAFAAADPATATPPRVLTLHLERGDTLRVLTITPRSDGMAAVRGLDGSTRYLSLSSIRRVEDALGMDRTGEVLREGKRLGEASPSEGAWRRFRLRPGPPGVCGSYLITDTAVLWSVSGSDAGDYERDKNEMVSLAYGYARNVGRAHSLGGTVFLLGDYGRARAGLRARWVRWLGRDVSLDLGPGIVLLANEEGEAEFKGPGFSGQAGLTFFGVAGVVVEVTSVTRRNSPYAYTLPNATVHETRWHTGARLSGVPGVGGTVALGVLLVMALGSLSAL
jgi:hypothetical protein